MDEGAAKGNLFIFHEPQCWGASVLLFFEKIFEFFDCCWRQISFSNIGIFLDKKRLLHSLFITYMANIISRSPLILLHHTRTTMYENLLVFQENFDCRLDKQGCRFWYCVITLQKIWMSWMAWWGLHQSYGCWK